ncbi:MAG: phosphodiesterase [Ruminococcaceae bacterium]|nr:phosphodiesterase [Oscillospiraceae bacterium]
MKLFIASDLHGSAYYTDLMLDRFEKSGASHLVLLGDILYHGPRNDLPKDYAPKKVTELLNKFSNRIIAVRGNCEAEVDSLMLDFSCQSDYGTIFDGEQVIYLSHGHRVEPKMCENTVYMTGHTHIPLDKTENGVRYVNPGSVSIPKENSPHSAIIWYNGSLSWIDLISGEKYSPNNK